MRAKFTPDCLDSIREMVKQELPIEQIAYRLGSTIGSIKATCSRHKISLRGTHTRPRPPLVIQPDLRLAIRLLQRIERDNLIAAVLDETADA